MVNIFWKIYMFESRNRSIISNVYGRYSEKLAENQGANINLFGQHENDEVVIH